MKRRVFLTGDTHGGTDLTPTLNTKFFPDQRELTKDDILIILGDFGLVWSVNESSGEEQYWVDWLSSRNYTTVVVLGNHENYDRIFQLPEVEMFGNKVWQYTDSIFILQRGRCYTINDKIFFSMGGAESIDKAQRRLNITWWEAEIPSFEEFDRGQSEIIECDNTVDYVVTHTAPRRVISMYMNACRDVYIQEFASQYVGPNGDIAELPEEFYDRITDTYIDTEYFDVKKDAVADYLDSVMFDGGFQFTKQFFGHFHDNWVSKNGKHVLVYRKVIELDTDTGEIRECERRERP